MMLMTLQVLEEMILMMAIRLMGSAVDYNNNHPASAGVGGVDSKKLITQHIMISIMFQVGQSIISMS